jgi:serine/threonine protein kinase
MPDDPSLTPLATIDQPLTAAQPSTLEAQTGAFVPLTQSDRPTDCAPPADWPCIPGYTLTRLIARGGMGRVFAGHEVKLDREVAIKTLLPHANAERFLTESRITARLPHPGIPPVYALGSLDDCSPYLVMKLIHGRTLTALLKDRSTPSPTSARATRV